MNDRVWLATSLNGNKYLLYGRISGIQEKWYDGNVQYVYNISVDANSDTHIFFTDNQFTENRTFKSVNIENIFTSVKEAKQSALNNLRRKYSLQMNEINTFFGQFEKKKEQS